MGGTTQGFLRVFKESVFLEKLCYYVGLELTIARNNEKKLFRAVVRMMFRRNPGRLQILRPGHKSGGMLPV